MYELLNRFKMLKDECTQESDILLMKLDKE